MRRSVAADAETTSSKTERDAGEKPLVGGTRRWAKIAYISSEQKVNCEASSKVGLCPGDVHCKVKLNDNYR